MSKKQYRWAASLHQCYADLPKNCKRHWKALTTLDDHDFSEPIYCWEPKWNITVWELAKCAPMFAAGAIPVDPLKVMADIKERKEKITPKQRNRDRRNATKGRKTGGHTNIHGVRSTAKQGQQDSRHESTGANVRPSGQPES